MALCTHFTQNAWRKDLCANCFKSRGEHGGGVGAAGAGAPRYLSSVCASRWRALADGPLQAKAPLQGILRARAAATSVVSPQGNAATPGTTAATPRRRAANGNAAGNSVRFSADQPQVIGEGGGDWPSDDEHNEEESGAWRSYGGGRNGDHDGSAEDDEVEEEDEDARALQRLTRTNTHLNAAPPEKEEEILAAAAAAATTNGVLAADASPRRAPLALGRPLTGADGQRRAPLLVAVTPFGAGGAGATGGAEERSSRIPVASRARPNGGGAGAGAAVGAASAGAGSVGASPARDKRRKEEENERQQLRRKNSAEVNIEHVTTSESTTDDSLSSAISAPKGVPQATTNGPTNNGTTPITNGPITNAASTDTSNTNSAITKSPPTNSPITNGPSTKASSIVNGPSTNSSNSPPTTDSSPITTKDLSREAKGPVVANVKVGLSTITAPRQVVGEDAPNAQKLADLAVDAKRPEKLVGTAAPSSQIVITARAEPALAKLTGDVTPPLKDVEGGGDLARADPDGRADPEGGPSEPSSAPAAAPPTTPTGIDPRPSFLHSRLPRGAAASGSATTAASAAASANGKPAVPAKPEVRLGHAPGSAARQVIDTRTPTAASICAVDGKEKEIEKEKEEKHHQHQPMAVASISSHWSSGGSACSSPAACIPVLIPTVPPAASSSSASNGTTAIAAEGAAGRTPKRPAPRPPPPSATPTPTHTPPASEVDDTSVTLLEEKKEDEEEQVMKEKSKEEDEKARGEQEEKPTEERILERPTTLHIVPQQSQPQPQVQPHPLLQAPHPPSPSPPPPLVPVQQQSTPSLSTSSPVTPAPPTPSNPVTPTATTDHRPQKAPKPKFSLRKLLRFGGRGNGGSHGTGAGAAGGLSEGGNGGTDTVQGGHGAGGTVGPHATSPTRPRPEIVHPLELRGSPERVDAPPRRSPQEPLYVNGGLVNSYNAGRPAQPPPPPRAPASSPSSSAATTPTASGGPRPLRPPPPRTNSLPGAYAPAAAATATSAAPGPRQPPPRTCGMLAVGSAAATTAAMGPNGCAVDGLYANLGEARSALAPHKPQRSGSLREAPGGGGAGGDSDPGYEQVLNGPPRPVSDSGDGSNEPVYERVRAFAPAAASGGGGGGGGGGRAFPRSASLPACYGPWPGADLAFHSPQPHHTVGCNGAAGGRLASRPALHRSLEDAYGAVVGANHEALAHALERVTLSLSAAPPSLPLAVVRALRTAADAEALRFAHFRPAPAPASSAPGGWQVADAGGRRWTRGVWDAQGGASTPCGVEVTLCVGAPGRGGLRAAALGARGLAHAALAPLAEFSASAEELPPALRPPPPSPLAPNATQHNTVWVSVVAPSRVQSLQEYGQMLQATAGAAGARWHGALALLQLVNALKALQARGQEEAVVSGFVVMLPPDAAAAADVAAAAHAQSPGAAAADARVVALPEAAALGGGGGSGAVAAAEAQSLCACVDAGLRLLLPASAPLHAPLHALLRQERADSLSRVQAALEFSLWGPSPSPPSAAARDEEEALQRWLDLERASELRSLVDAFTSHCPTPTAPTPTPVDGGPSAVAAAETSSKATAVSVPAAAAAGIGIGIGGGGGGGGSAAGAVGGGGGGGGPAASVAERCRLWFLVRTSARALVDAARLLGGAEANG